MNIKEQVNNFGASPLEKAEVLDEQMRGAWFERINRAFGKVVFKDADGRVYENEDLGVYALPTGEMALAPRELVASGRVNRCRVPGNTLVVVGGGENDEIPSGVCVERRGCGLVPDADMRVWVIVENTKASTGGCAYVNEGVAAVTHDPICDVPNLADYVLAVGGQFEVITGGGELETAAMLVLGKKSV